MNEAAMAGAKTRGSGQATSARFRAVIVVLLFTEVLSSLEQSMMIAVLPKVARQVGDTALAGWLATSFLLAQAATAALGGRLGDIFGRRRVLLFVVSSCCLGSLVSLAGAHAGSLELIILGRVIQGASGAILPLSYGIVRELGREEKAPFWIGFLTGGYSFANAAGYIVGGYLSDIGSWTSIFQVTTLYSALLIPPLLLVVPAISGVAPRGRFDIWGAVLFSPAVAAMLYGITVSQQLGWLAPRSGALFLAGLAVVLLWFRYEWHRKDPLIDVRLLARTEIWLGNLCSAFANIGMMQLPVIILLLMQQPVAAGIGLGISGALAGILKLPSNISALFGASISGWLASRAGARQSLMVGALLSAVAWTYLFFFHGSVLHVVLGLVVCSFGAAMVLAAVPNLVLQGAPLERSSEVTGLAMVIRTIFNAIGLQVVTILLASSSVIDPASGARFPSSAAYLLSIAYVAITSGVIVVLCLIVRVQRGAARPVGEIEAAQGT